jgi:hypothetical protein
MIFFLQLTTAISLQNTSFALSAFPNVGLLTQDRITRRLVAYARF